LAKLNAIFDEFRHRENIQKRRLVTWLTEDEYKNYAIDWES
jgi:hypothetical protein